MSAKTEEATPRRIRRARREGDSGASAYGAQSVSFVAAVAIVPAALRALASRSAADLRNAIAEPPGLGGMAVLDRFDARSLAGEVTWLVVPAMAVVAATAAAAHLLQTGGAVAFGKVTPRLDRLNPVRGLAGLLSGPRLFAVVRAFVAAALIAWLAYRDLSERLVDLARLAARASWTGAVVKDLAGRFVWQAAAIGLALGLVDVLVARRAWLRRLRMTKEEVRRDHKEAEGDPIVRAARQRAHREVVNQAAVAAVRSATVVVVNPTHLACALRYDAKGGDPAPMVVASGEGDVAARIARAAHEWGIPVVRDVPLARALVELEVGETIPEALYEAVAEILRELYESELGDLRP